VKDEPYSISLYIGFEPIAIVAISAFAILTLCYVLYNNRKQKEETVENESEVITS
jgi:hypothetical protein